MKKTLNTKQIEEKIKRCADNWWRDFASDLGSPPEHYFIKHVSKLLNEFVGSYNAWQIVSVLNEDDDAREIARQHAENGNFSAASIMLETMQNRLALINELKYNEKMQK